MKLPAPHRGGSFMAFACCLLAGLCTSRAAAQPELIVFSEMGANTTAMDLNDAGQVLITGPANAAWRWQNGVYDPLLAPAPINAVPGSPCYGLGYGTTVDFAAAYGVAINEAGVVVGSTPVEFGSGYGSVPVVWTNPSTPVRWRDTSAAPNCCLCASFGFAGISNDGVPVGPDGGTTWPFAGSGPAAYSPLAHPSAWSSGLAHDRNSSGLTVGAVRPTSGGGSLYPAAWPATGAPYLLAGGEVNEIARHVNEQGQILSDRALYQPDGTRTVITWPNNITSGNQDLNDLGVVLGGVYLRKDGVFYDIRNYLPTGFSINTVRAINNKNWVVGSGHYTGGSTYGFLLKMNLPCFAVTAPSPTNACPGDSATFATSPNGTGPFTYKWRHDGVPIDTATNPSAEADSLVLTDVSAADEGFYDCMVTNACGSVTSDAATLTVLDENDPACAGCPACAADYDDNGGVDGGDLAAFFLDFEAGESCADVDSNGGVDGGDLAFFFVAFEAGGC